MLTISYSMMLQIGAFHPPAAVFIDPLVLRSLPARQLRNGMAEIIKAGAIASSSLFELLEQHAGRLQPSMDPSADPSASAGDSIDYELLCEVIREVRALLSIVYCLRTGPCTPAGIL